MGDSNARRELKKEKPEWTFTQLKNGKGLRITHMTEVKILSEKELRDVMKGYLEKEYWMEVIVDEEGHKIHVMKQIDLSRFTWLPKYMYRKFLKEVCDVLGLIYRPQMLEAVTARPLTPKAVVVFPEKGIIEKTEERVVEIVERGESIKREVDNIREFVKGLKEMEKK